MAYRIVYSAVALSHMRGLRATEQALVLDTVQEQLAHQPDQQTRHRKRMRPNTIARWELRIGHLRVYYDIELEPDAHVEILAIGIKDRNVVRVAGKVIET